MGAQQFGASVLGEITVRKPKVGDLILADDKAWTVNRLALDKYGDIEKVGVERGAWYGRRNAWFNVHSILYLQRQS